MNSEQISLSGFSLKTFLSQIDADIKVGGDIIEQKNESPVSALLSLRVAMQDIYALYPDLQKEIALLPIETLKANTHRGIRYKTI